MLKYFADTYRGGPFLVQHRKSNHLPFSRLWGSGPEETVVSGVTLVTIWHHGEENITQKCSNHKSKSVHFKAFPPSLHTVGTQCETWNLEQCILKLRPARLASQPLIFIGNKNKKSLSFWWIKGNTHKKAFSENTHPPLLLPGSSEEATTTTKVSVSSQAPSQSNVACFTQRDHHAYLASL